MHHAAAILSSLGSLGLVCAIYACNILSRPGSPWRSEILAMILLALLTGIFPLAATASLVGLWEVLTGGLTVTALLAAGADLAAVAACVAAIWVFRALVRETYRAPMPTGAAVPDPGSPVNRNRAPGQSRAA